MDEWKGYARGWKCTEGRGKDEMSRRSTDRNIHAEGSQINVRQMADMLRENQKLIALGRLTASIAHEINNPLESITNLLYLIEQDSSEKRTDYLRMAQRELDRVVEITRKTLSFSRETKQPVRLQFADLVEEVLVLHARRIGAKNLRVVRQYYSHAPVTVFPGEMRQVISNLISNAVDAMAQRGRIVLRIRSGCRWMGNGRSEPGLRFSIGDNGRGIPEPVRRRLGEPFFTTKGQSGTGLGLWVTRSILVRYGGSLRVRSSVMSTRHGTVFSLFLPFGARSFTLLPGEGKGEMPSPHPHGLRLVEVERPRLAMEDDSLEQRICEG